MGVVRIPFSTWFNNEYQLGTTHSDSGRSWDLLFSRRGNLNKDYRFNYSS
jgi:hypothetical protein